MRIILIFAELERKTTAERVTAVMLSRASDGQWNGGRVPFGYSWSKETKTFSIVPEEAKAIRRMAELYGQYQSLLYVASTSTTPASSQRRAANGHRPRYAPS